MYAYIDTYLYVTRYLGRAHNTMFLINVFHKNTFFCLLSLTYACIKFLVSAVL